MFWKKRLGKELIFFALTVGVSLLFWFIIANITDQCIVARECQYDKERDAFVISIGFFYLARLIAGLAI